MSSANENNSGEEFIDEMLNKLNTSFGSRQVCLQNYINETEKSILNLRHGLTNLKLEEVAALVRREESIAFVQEKMHQNFPDGVSMENINAIIKFVNVACAAQSGNLIKAINFVQVFYSHHHAHAYKSIFDHAKLKYQTEEPEMLLLQKQIDKLQEQPGADFDPTKMQLDAACGNAIARIVAGIKSKDYFLSIYLAKSIDSDLLNNNMTLIVSQFTNTLENTLLLIQYADKLPYIENICYLIDALLLKLEKGHLLETQQAMHLWVLAKSI